MVRYLTLFFFWALASASASLAAPPDVTGWQEAKWGMTEPQLLKAFKGKAVSLSAPKETSDQGRSTVHIPQYEIQGENFEVAFWFKGKTLSEVDLQIKRFTKRPVELYMAIEQMMKSKYGQPTKENKDKPGISMIWNDAWNFKSTTIYLIWTGSGTNSDEIELRYLMTPKDADKL